jgi:hypothetical protein
MFIHLSAVRCILYVLSKINQFYILSVASQFLHKNLYLLFRHPFRHILALYITKLFIDTERCYILHSPFTSFHFVYDHLLASIGSACRNQKPPQLVMISRGGRNQFNLHSSYLSSYACRNWHGVAHRMGNPLPRLHRACPSTSLDKILAIWNLDAHYI